MKVGKTKTHHKLYVTDNELKVLHFVYGEGMLSFDDVNNWPDDLQRAALERVATGLTQASLQDLK